MGFGELDRGEGKKLKNNLPLFPLTAAYPKRIQEP